MVAQGSGPDFFKPLPSLPKLTDIPRDHYLRPDGKNSVLKERVSKQTIFTTTTETIDYEKHIRDNITYALHLKYTAIIETSQSLEENMFFPNYYLVMLTKTITEELDQIQSNFDLIICDKIHFPSFCAGLYFARLERLYQDFSYTLKDQRFDLGFAMELYQNVRRLQLICEMIDFKLSDSFKMVMWFRVAIYEWLETVETKVNEWVENSLKQDDFKLLFESHSSCVLDIFTSFQHTVDFIKELNWPDEHDQHMFYFAVMYDVIVALEKFEVLLYFGLIEDLERAKGFQQPPAAKSAKLGKFKVPIPKMIRKKVVQSPDGSCRISPEACVRMLNLCAIPSRFDTLCLNIPGLQNENLESPGGLFEKGYRRMMCITILEAELKAYKPWSTKISIRLSNEDGKHIGESSKIYQASHITWNESIYMVCGEEELIFTVDIIHNHDRKSERFNGQSFKTGRLMMRKEKLFIIDVMGGGTIHIQIKILPETNMALTTTVSSRTESLVSKVIDNMVSQVQKTNIVDL
jgi:hypothetical protein